MIIYHWTGEYHPPEKGEWFIWSDEPRYASYDYPMSQPAFILRREELPDTDAGGE